MTFLLLVALQGRPANAVSRWTLFCERHLIGYDFSEEIEALWPDRLCAAYLKTAAGLWWAREPRRADVHRLRQFGAQIRALGLCDDVIERYQHLEADR